MDSRRSFLTSAVISSIAFLSVEAWAQSPDGSASRRGDARGGPGIAGSVPSPDSLIGQWSINWQGAQDRYAGKLEIFRAKGSAELRGKLTLLPARGGIVTEDARITIGAEEIRIECSNPKIRDKPETKSWNPDRFFVHFSGNELHGHSVDSGGQRGSQIVFTKL